MTIVDKDFNGNELGSMIGCSFEDCSFIQSEIAHIGRIESWHDCRFANCNFEAATLRRLEMDTVTMLGCNLRHVDFAGCKLLTVDISRSDVRGAIGLPECSPIADLDFFVLRTMQLDGVYISGTPGPGRVTLDELVARVAWGRTLTSWQSYALTQPELRRLAAQLTYQATIGSIPDFQAEPHEIMSALRERAGQGRGPHLR